MANERVNCPHCPVCDVGPNHIERCKVRTAALAEAEVLGAARGVPAVTTADLWAHLGHVAMPQDATRIVRQVIDLGWRPVVGSDPKRLWSSESSNPPAGGEG